MSSSQARQADSLLDELFDDLEHSLDEGLAEEEYPYFGTRPPLRSRRSSASGGMLLGMALAATLVAGLAFWMTLRPRPVIFSGAERSWLSNPTEGDPLAEAPLSPVDQEPLLTSATEKPPEESPVETESSTATPDSKPVTVPAVVASAPPPPAVVPAPPVPARRIPSQPMPRMKLVGLIHDPGDPKALILIDNVVRQVPVGHAVKADWRVTSISPYGVGVSNGAQSVTLQLGLSQQI
ncbi:MAG: hypothetical protein Q6L60_14585 [Thermostichus sp. HHBFW_bins_43]